MKWVQLAVSFFFPQIWDFGLLVVCFWNLPYTSPFYYQPFCSSVTWVPVAPVYLHPSYHCDFLRTKKQKELVRN